MLSIIIPTYRRERVLLDTVSALLRQLGADGEILLMDQTGRHDPDTDACLADWAGRGLVHWHRLESPGTARALNAGLCLARHETVLILDDDIIPGDSLLRSHQAALHEHPNAWCVAGQVLQPGEEPVSLTYAGAVSGLRAYVDFPFSSNRAMAVGNVMAGNLSIRRDRALAIGGFDENFGPPVSYRFETEFARRVLAAGGEIWFEPSASIRHLRASEGGTRVAGGHLRSASPVHGVGDYYYAMRCGRGWDRVWYMMRRPWREVMTRFHLAHPWFIPVKLTGEFRALGMAFCLARKGPRFLGRARENGA